MKVLYFKDAHEKETKLKTFETEPRDQEVLSFIRNDALGKGYEVYYIRYYAIDEVIVYDFGSYSEFYLLKNK